MLIIVLKMKPGSIIHGRTIDGPRMADRHPVCIIFSPCRPCAVSIHACLRLALVFFLAQALGFTWTVEMPPKLREHPRWSHFGEPTKTFAAGCSVSCWGAAKSPSKLRLLSNSRAILVFHERLQARLAKKMKSRIYASWGKKRHSESHGRKLV